MRTTSRAAWLAPLLVALITIAVFVPALKAGFVTWDDDRNFLTNQSYRGLDATHLRWMWTTFHLGHYVPLSWMTLGLDYVVWGMNPFGYHLTSVLLHAANAVLVYHLARRLLPGVVERTDGRTGAQDEIARLSDCLPAILAALLFSIHPLRVESVAWVTERRDVLSLFFSLTSVLWYLRSCDGSGNGRAWYAASIIAFACALLSKATSVTLPAMLLILNVYPLKRLGAFNESRAIGQAGSRTSPRHIALEVAPFVALAAATVGMTFVALPHLAQLGGFQKVAVSAYSLTFYLWKTIAPIGLAPLYAMPTSVDPIEPRFVAAYAVLMAITLGTWLVRRRWPALTAAALLSLVTVAPMLGFVQNGPQIAADRYTYFAGPVVAILGASLFVALRRRAGELAIGAAALVLVVLADLTWRQAEVWHDSTSLWTQVLRVEPDSPLAHNNMGNVLLLERQLNDAVGHYRRALAAAPGYAEARNNLGVALARQGNFSDAIAQYQRALATNPAYAEAHANWGIALDAMGNPAESIAHFQRALALDPGNVDAQVNWGNALITLGRPDEAIRRYEDVVRRRPDNAAAHLNWGVALARKGSLVEAIGQFRRALELQPGSPEARAYLDKTIQVQRTTH